MEDGDASGERCFVDVEEYGGTLHQYIVRLSFLFFSLRGGGLVFSAVPPKSRHSCFTRVTLFILLRIMNTVSLTDARKYHTDARE
ncbi:hypothetical protein FKM82_028982 [Ascaphus truei]